MRRKLSSYKSFIIKQLAFSLIMLTAWSCATIEAPGGGPKDETPPELVKTYPGLKATNFSGDKLVFTFNEYIQLETPEKFLLVSPPLAQTPELKVKGHSVVIKLPDSLRPNTTYNFYMGDAIADLTEGNAFSNFSFAFATGAVIDSLSMRGIVSDAFTRLPVEGAYVLLYTNFTDSVPLTQMPVYVSRTLKDGSFSLNSLASGKYRVVALMDANSDYKYNPVSEKIGFNSDSVQPWFTQAEAKDSVSRVLQNEANPLISIDIFAEPDSSQRILKSVIASVNRLNIAFRYPVKNMNFRALNVSDSIPWAVTEWNSGNDTVNAWLLQTPDTLKLEISENNIILDTVVISTKMKTSGKNRKNDAVTTTKLAFTTSASGRELGYKKQFIVKFSNPIAGIKKELPELIIKNEKDTLTVKPELRFTDSIHRHLLIDYQWLENTSYELYFPSGTFTDIYNNPNDSTRIQFTELSVNEYGKLAIVLKRSLPDPVLIYLLNEKGEFLSQTLPDASGKVDFGYLLPGKYGIKAILDANNNGKWDTGVFLKNKQPEKVLVHPKIFEVRTNWELEEIWEL